MDVSLQRAYICLVLDIWPDNLLYSTSKRTQNLMVFTFYTILMTPFLKERLHWHNSNLPLKDKK